jgi:XTP/dITP diphosphohydrolase
MGPDCAGRRADSQCRDTELNGTSIVLASHNPGKLEELRRLLPEGLQVILARDLGIELPLETGSTFAENAIVKAESAAAHARLPAIGDDSGLEVDALGGAPGIHSARFAGESRSDAANMTKLLSQLEGISAEKRTARFRCVVAFAMPDGTLRTATGAVEGRIGFEPRGNAGFGYDPLFELSDGRTFAEIPAEEKDAISHRGRALRQLAPIIGELVASDHRGT